MTNILTQEELNLWLAFLRTSVSLNRKLAEEMRQQSGVPIAWYDVLVHLYHGDPAGVRMQDLAEQVLMSSSGLTRLLDRMIEAGLVAREFCEDDRRVIFAVLTGAGRTLIEELLPQHQARIRNYFIARLTQAEMGIMSQALRRIQENLTAVPQ